MIVRRFIAPDAVVFLAALSSRCDSLAALQDATQLLQAVVRRAAQDGDHHGNPAVVIVTDRTQAVGPPTVLPRAWLDAGQRRCTQGMSLNEHVCIPPLPGKLSSLYP